MKKKKLVFGLISFIIIIAVVICFILLRKEKKVDNSSQATIIIENESISNSNKDESVVNVDENSNASIKNSTIEKSGDSSDVTESDKKGLNSAILINILSTININDSKVTTNGIGSTGVASVGAGAIATIENSNIATSQDRSKGILASEKGRIIGSELNIETKGYKSSAVATDRGGGIINLEDSKINTQGEDSAGLYSTGDIIVENSTIESLQAEGAVIDGNGKIEIFASNLKSGKKRGVMIYYTGPMIGNKECGIFKMYEGSFEIQDGPAFYVTNTTAEIYLSNVKIVTTSGVFLDVSIDKYGELGQEGGYVESKGGNAKVYLTEQTVEGNITVDSQSTVELSLENNSNFTGAINAENTGKSIKVVLDETSTWTLTGNSYITALDAAEGAKINTNGYKINYIEPVTEENEQNNDSPYGPGSR